MATQARPRSGELQRNAPSRQTVVPTTNPAQSHEQTEIASLLSSHFSLPTFPTLPMALTHSSAAATVAESNERLEFLGDALLSAFVARYLFEALPPDTPEDVLTRARVQIVRRETLAEAGRKIGLPDVIRMGAGEQKERRSERDSVVADTFEAVIAAIFLDAGEETMNRFLQETLAEPLAAVVATPPENDPKTRLQIRLQTAGQGLPHYETVSEINEGAYHHFVVEVRDGNGTVLGQGEGPTKRAAQRAAARNALV